MSDQLRLINVDAVWRRVLLLVPAALVCFGVWLALRWFVGDTMATYPSNVEVAHLAERLAPDDPQAHFTAGVFARNEFTPDQLSETVREFERATALAPHDYRLWMELGRAREQAGDAAGGELALRRALALAPNYVMPRWYLGNLLLRAGRESEAVSELRAAAESDRELRGPIFASVWSIFNGDVERLTASVAQTPSVRGELVEYLVRQKRVDDALRLWSSLAAPDRKQQHEAGDMLARGLLEGRRYGAAFAVYEEAGAGAHASVGQVANGGFEEEIGAPGKDQFGWSVTPVAQAQIGIDPRLAHGGGHALRVTFNAPSSITFANVSQLIVVEPGARYRLEFFVRTENLKTVSSLVVDVVSGAADAKTLATSAPAPGGTTEWQPVSVEFTAPADVDGVMLRVRRDPCPEEACPIFGKIWYDDFNLQRANSAGGARAAVGDNGTAPKH
ncbi:MAG: carbohydrate binding domain-containing protein [Pyrinomonadaceae bacterium]